ncbi:MAG: lecithin retinol acyltransferase family protein [Verrucomicrobiota bacterium]|nr:lecithin retinol acyltransferase family protein [Verrucomicrobiota bacterium]
MNIKLVNTIATVVASVKALSDRTGFSDSLISGVTRAAEERKLSDPPPPGTPLLCSVGYVEHSGIYLGEGRVAEVSVSKGVGLLKEVSLTTFLNGGNGVKSKVRTGNVIYAACDAETGFPLHKDSVAQNAVRFMNEHHAVDYSIVANNCHLFTISCVTGEFLNAECEEMNMQQWIGKVAKTIHTLTEGDAKSIKRLESAIMAHLNEGRPVAWISVVPSTNFHYEVLEHRKASKPSGLLELPK